MKSILHATVILSSSSIVTILVGLVSAKFFALVLGPGGMGTMGLIQALVALTALIAGMGVGTGLVRMGSSALGQKDYVHVVALRQATWLLFWVWGSIGLLIMVLFRTPISRLMLGGPEHAHVVVLMGIALLFNLASGYQTSILNAYHRVNALAKFGVFNSVIGTGASLLCVWLWHEQGIVPAILASAVIGWSISTYFLLRQARQEAVRPSRFQVFAAMRSLLRFGVPYNASLMVGTGVQFVLPALVLHMLSTEDVGFYRAALSVSGMYLGFLLLAMGQDYFPRISTASHKPAELVHLVNQQHRLVMLVSVPIILGMLALAPILVPLIYSPEFTPTVEILEWYLISDIFKFTSWTMGFVILVRSGSVVLFLVELLVGINLVVTSWLGVQWFGLAGLGIGFLITYIIHYVVVWIIVRKDIRLIWTAQNKWMFLAAVLAALLIRVLPVTGLEYLRTPVAVSLAILASLGSFYVIWQEVGGIQYVRAWLRGNAT